MKLLVFALKREAKIFLSNNSYKKSKFIKNLYVCPSHYLLITGIGLELAEKSLINVCNHMQEKITEIFNLGISGALDNSLKYSKVYSIRTIKITNGIELLSNNPDGDIDLFTSQTAILNDADAKKINKIAPLVDMEAYNLLKIAITYNIPFYCYKLVSDFPSKMDVIKHVNNEATNFGLILYKFSKKLNII